MRKILFAAIISVFLTLPFISFQNISGQTQKIDAPQKAQDEKKLPDSSTAEKDLENIPEFTEIDDSGHYSYKWLSLDMRMVDVVAYVDVKEVKYSGRDSETTDCENNKGGGYCGYDLIAEVKEVFKGKLETKSIELSSSADATYPKNNFLGEKVVFLTWTEGDDKKKYLVEQLENSSRLIKNNVLEKLRNLFDPNSPINEDDEENPYSIKYIGNNFQEADAVVYANVLSFKPVKSTGFGIEPFVLKAEIKEVFKGGLKAGQSFEYHDDLLHRPMREEDLGEQILYLEKKVENGKTYYEKVNYTEGWIRHDILEKLRRIANGSSNTKK